MRRWRVEWVPFGRYLLRVIVGAALRRAGRTFEPFALTDRDAVGLEQVARRFGRRWALRGVTLRVAPGEAVVLLGRNGSGKTTLLRVLSTALRPTRGTGTVWGHDLAGDPDGVRRNIGYLSHESGLYLDLTARENLEFALRMSGGRRALAHASVRHDGRLDESLEEVGLLQASHERVRGFSAGMKRRLALARALLVPPRLLLLDEPYAAFDASGIALVHRFVGEVREAGGSAIVATHDPDRAAVVADRWTRMQDGRVVEIRRPAAGGAELAATTGDVA